MIITILMSITGIMTGLYFAKRHEVQIWKDYAKKRDEEMLELHKKHSQIKLELYEKQLIERGK